jgi:PD-(D/E)XK endonuclease
MDTAARGNAAEAAVLSTLVGRGYRVLVPFGGGHPCDLVVDVGSAFVRVQCKTGWESRGCILFNSYSTDHGNGALPYTDRPDIFGVYFPPSRAVYLVPISAVARHEGRLRLVPARNNQRRRTRPAAEFALDRWTSEALARLVAAA